MTRTCMFLKVIFAVLLFNTVKVYCLEGEELQVLQKRFESYYASNDSSKGIKVKGITVGGWLVTEPYITPSLYNNATEMMSRLTHNSSDYNLQNSSIIDEYTMCNALGYEGCKNLLDSHFNTWITEDDFKQMSEDGFNLVRIPIGYWAWKVNHTENVYVDGITFEDPYVGEGIQLSYLNKAIGWAEKYGLNVWIDLHGAPGSQNGFDNSGQRNFYYDLGWLSDFATKNLTLSVWDNLFDSYLNQNDCIVGFEILNEPLSSKIDIKNITQAYYDAFKIFKSKNGSQNTTFIIHDAFEGIGHWNLELNPKYHNVSDHYTSLSSIDFNSQQILVDHHHYEVFTGWQLANNQYNRLMDIINYGESISKELRFHPAVVGEWSGAITDCARWLNGVGIGARYDNSYYNTTRYSTDDEPVGPCQSQFPIELWNETYRVDVRQFIEAQIATYNEKTTGWIFWNWKTENAYEWDYLQLKSAGLFPSPLDNFTYFGSDGSINSQVSASLSREAYPQTATSMTGTKTTGRNGKSKNAAAALGQHQIIFNNISTMISTILAGVFLAY